MEITPKMQQDLKDIKLSDAEPWEIDKALFGKGVDGKELEKRVKFSKEFKENHSKKEKDKQ